MIKFEAKKVMIKEKGSSSLYAATNRLIPKNRKKAAIKTNKHCLIHQNIRDMILFPRKFILKKAH